MNVIKYCFTFKEQVFTSLITDHTDFHEKIIHGIGLKYTNSR